MNAKVKPSSFLRWLTFFASACCASCTAASSLNLVLNPYAGIDWRDAVHHKGNFHTHTTASDGHMSPHVVIDHYHQRGYSILAITDHNRVTYPWTAFSSFSPSAYSRNQFGDNLESVYQDRDPEELGMVAVAGNELSDHHHLLSLFSRFTTEERNLAVSLNGIVAHADDGIAILAHPFHSWSLKAGSIQIPLAPTIRDLTMDDFTVELWFRTTDERRNIPFGNFDAGDRARGSLNLELHTENRVRVHLQSPEEDGGRTVDILVRAGEFGINTRDGNWHHLAGVRRDGNIRLFLNGEELRSRADTAGPFQLCGSNFYIGRDARVNYRFYDAISVMTHPTTFNGDIARVRIWSRGLSDEEIAAIASDRPKADTFPPLTGLVAEYGFETLQDVKSLQDGVVNLARVIDSANHPDGPFHATGTLFRRNPDAPPALRHADASSYSARFGASHPHGWQFIPDALIDHYQTLFADYPVLVGIEVHGSTGRRSPMDVELWDNLLGHFMPERPVWGIANDDMHAYDQMGRNWSVFPGVTLTREAVRSAMKSGAYYFVTTDRYHGPQPNSARVPAIESIRHDEVGGRLIVRAKVAGESLPDDAFQWVSGCTVVRTGPVLEYRDCGEITNYARLEILGCGGTVYTNPFGFK